MSRQYSKQTIGLEHEKPVRAGFHRSIYDVSVLPEAVTARVSVEAGITLGWERWVGSAGRSIGVDRYGASAPAGKILSEFGITVDALVAAAEALLG